MHVSMDECTKCGKMIDIFTDDPGDDPNHPLCEECQIKQEGDYESSKTRYD